MVLLQFWMAMRVSTRRFHPKGFSKFCFLQKWHFAMISTDIHLHGYVIIYVWVWGYMQRRFANKMRWNGAATYYAIGSIRYREIKLQWEASAGGNLLLVFSWLIAVDRHSFWVLAYVGEVLHMGCNHNSLYYEKIHTTPVVITLGHIQQLLLNNKQ